MKPKDYIIEFNKLRKGSNEFAFVIDDAFLSTIEGEHPAHAKAVMHLDLLKTDTMYDLNFKLEGTVMLACDVCLDEFDLPLDACFQLIMKISEVENYSDDEIIYISPNLLEFDLTQYLYESLMLSLPIKKVCSMGKKGCNAEVLKKLEEVKPADSNSNENTDPRWDELKKIINN